MLDIVVMAAGLGTRMKSRQAKVLHKLGGHPLISHVCRTAALLAPDGFVVVVGHQAAEVENAVRSTPLPESGSLPEAKFALQREQLGTGHAVLQTVDLLSGGTVIVLSGDVPLVEPTTLQSLLDAHRAGGYAATLLSTKLLAPTGYGRIVRGPADDFRRIVEQKDASPSERALGEINAGIYAFETSALVPALQSLSTGNAQGEYYLTDVLGILVEEGRHVGVLRHDHPHEVLGINTRVDLAASEARMRARTLERLMLEGVTIVDPATVYVDAGIEIGRDTTIMPGVVLQGATSIGEGCTIGPWVHLTDATIADRVHVRASTVIEGAHVEHGALVGPFSRLRPGAHLAEDVHVGNFVEVKNSTLGKGTKANHLTYIGDAEVGSGVNFGAGTVTCNYDGKRKHKTTIEDGVHLGSNTMLVAPVRVGRGSKTGAGTVVTRDVPERTLAVGVPARVLRSLEEE
jgi:bifunctional UDP-N-acetylglucosamine pyrophosphorylase / glucosamine-1-phosphate N-acetyltransferase